jgi:hypothetical protein
MSSNVSGKSRKRDTSRSLRSAEDEHFAGISGVSKPRDAMAQLGVKTGFDWAPSSRRADFRGPDRPLFWEWNADHNRTRDQGAKALQSCYADAASGRVSFAETHGCVDDATDLQLGKGRIL